jgi:hypothetical protein
MAKIKANIKSSVKKGRGGVKAGSTMPKNVGGYVNAKVTAIAKKRRG